MSQFDGSDFDADSPPPSDADPAAAQARRYIAHYWPGHYPARCPPDLALDIATAIARGASWKTACWRFGVATKRFVRWLKWGEDAYTRDADERDPHADYLNLFLKVGVAAALAAGVAEEHAFEIDPKWWLMHNPATRGLYGADGALAVAGAGATVDPVFDGETRDAEAAGAGTGAGTPATLAAPEPTVMRDVLRTLIEAAPSDPASAPATATAAPDRIVDAENEKAAS